MTPGFERTIYTIVGTYYGCFDQVGPSADSAANTPQDAGELARKEVADFIADQVENNGESAEDFFTDEVLIDSDLTCIHIRYIGPNMENPYSDSAADYDVVRTTLYGR